MNDFVSYLCDDIFVDNTDISSRAMFGGYGLYYQDVFFAIISDDTLYLYTKNRPSGATLFEYTKKGTPVTLSHYVKVDSEIIDNKDALLERMWDSIDDARER